MARRMVAAVLLVSCVVPLQVKAGSPALSIPKQFAPLYPEPPYEYRGGKLMIVQFKTTVDVLRRLVPEPLSPNPDGLMLLFIADWKTAQLGNYHEAGLLVPAQLGARQGAYAVVLYLDNVVPIAAGREKYGWPKKEARIALVEKEGLVTATVERGGTTLVRATVQREKAVDPEVLQKAKSAWFLLKIIPSAMGKGAPPSVAQIVCSTPKNRTVTNAMAGPASVELAGSAADPLNTIPIKEVLGGTYYGSDFDLADDEIVYDYLKESATTNRASR